MNANPYEESKIEFILQCNILKVLKQMFYSICEAYYFILLISASNEAL